MRTKRFQPGVWMALLGLIVSGLLWSTTALAQEKTQLMGACAQDAHKLCPDAKTSEARTQCLKSHETELSQGCKELQARAANARATAQTKKAACKSDAETLCKGVKTGGGAMLQCLKSHEADLSTACKATLPKSTGKTS